MPEDETMLVKAMQENKMEAFEEIIRRYQKKVYSLAFHLTHNQQDAEDVCQEVFLRVFSKINTFLGKSAFSSWIYRIALNVSYMKIKSLKKNPISLENVLPKYQAEGFHKERINDWSKQTDDILLGSELQQMIKKAVSQLPAKEKMVFILRDIEGMSTEKVCEVLELSVPAVKSRLHRSRLFLRKRLSTYYDGLK